MGHITLFNRRFVELWRIPKDIAESRDDERASAALRTGSAGGFPRLVASAEPARTSTKPIPIPALKDSCSTSTPRVAATAGLT